MKKYFTGSILGLFSLLLSIPALGQKEVADSLTIIGIQYHDEGNYDMAIKYYKKALKKDPNSVLIFYEMSMTYMYNGNYSKSIRYADKVIDQKQDYSIEALEIKASCLDYLGKPQEALDMYAEVEKLRGPNNMLYYNMALVHFKLEQIDSAIVLLEKGIQMNPGHPSSHLVLAYANQSKGRASQSAMGFAFFLMLESQTERSKDAVSGMFSSYFGNISSSEGGTQINISLPNSNDSSVFSTTDVILSLMAASIYNNEELSDYQKLKDVYSMMMDNLNKDETSYADLYGTLYYQVLAPIESSDHYEAFLRFITQSSLAESEDWLGAHPQEVEALFAWISAEN
ncbi:MAG: hypothetical protein SchgKO_15990 [Schleiferiaceae bacterium]